MKILQKPKKSLGQNFLTDDNIVKKIIEIGKINKNSVVLEIGPGYGHLTEKIISDCPSIVSINIKTEFGICSLGKPAKTNWNSLEIQNRLYLECSE